MRKFASPSGFTLVELLVVMAILGVLSVGLIVAINPRTQFVKTRDATRKAAIRQIQDAVERYRIIYGTYPVQTSWLYSNSAGWQTFLGSELKSVPIDPMQNNCATGYPFWDGLSCWWYAYYSDGTSYALVAHLENKNDPLRCETVQYKWFDGNSLCSPTYNWSVDSYVRGTIGTNSY